MAIYEKDKEVSIRIRITQELKNEIEKTVKDRGMTMSGLVRVAVKKYINELKRENI